MLHESALNLSNRFEICSVCVAKTTRLRRRYARRLRKWTYVESSRIPTDQRVVDSGASNLLRARHPTPGRMPSQFECSVRPTRRLSPFFSNLIRANGSEKKTLYYMKSRTQIAIQNIRLNRSRTQRSDKVVLTDIVGVSVRFSEPCRHPGRCGSALLC